jgi:hypothetical protein
LGDGLRGTSPACVLEAQLADGAGGQSDPWEKV